METSYDEDLLQNPFFRKLKEAHPDIIQTASLQKLIICVPRIGSFSEDLREFSSLTSHILEPSYDLPETHFNTENGEVVLKQRKLQFQDRSDGSLILFEEVFYTKEFLKYKVWCIDKPLSVNLSQLCSSKVNTTFVQINGLNEAVNFIWVNSNNCKQALRKIDGSINNFKKNNCGSRCKDIEKLKNNIHLLYNHCIDILLMNRQLKEKTKTDPLLLKNLKLSVETYLLNALYGHIFELITCFTAEENEKFNSSMRHMGDIQLTEFKVDAKLHEFIPAMKLELTKIDSQTTVLDKLTCLKKALNIISERYNKKNDTTNATILTTDDVIPALIFVIIKSTLTHWITNLYFLKNFSFTEFSSGGHECGAENFLIATLEASVTFILQNSEYHGQSLLIEGVEKRTTNEKFSSKTNYLNYLFSMIKSGKEDEVLRLLNPFTSDNNDSIENPFFEFPSLCHPLCNCSECKEKIADTTPSINSSSGDGKTAIFVAVMNGLPKMTTTLLSLNADVNVVDDSGWTPLHYASSRGYQNILLLLLHAKASINVINQDKNSPLHLACMYGNTNCCKALLYFAEHMKIPIDINLQNKHGDTALHIASKWGFSEMVQTLLESNARCGLVNKFGHSPIQIVHNTKIAEMLQNHSNQMSTVPRGTKNVNITDLDLMDNDMKQPQTLLHRLEKVDKVMNAIASNDTNLVLFLLGIHEKNAKCHPLCACDDCQKTKRPPTTLDVVDVNDQDTTGNTPLHIATLYGNTNLVKILLENGADITKTNHLGQTSLHVACKIDKSHLVNCILSAKATTTQKQLPIDSRDINGDTPLAYAAATGDAKLIETLLTFQPKLDIKNNVGQTPLDIAKENIFPTVMKILEDNLECLKISNGSEQKNLHEN